MSAVASHPLRVRDRSHLLCRLPRRRIHLAELAADLNVPNNRLDPTTFEGDGFQRMLQRLVELVPALKGGENVVSDPSEEGDR